MSNRFVDNSTKLNAETLNQFEKDLTYKICHAVFECYDSNAKVYRIDDVKWSDIPVGAMFSVIFDQNTKSGSNAVIGLKFGQESAKYIFYGMPDYEISFTNSQYVRENNRKYLAANRPYVMKKIVEKDFSVPMIMMMDHFDVTNFAATIEASSTLIALKNLDGERISSVDIKSVVESVTATFTVSGSTLNITTK